MGLFIVVALIVGVVIGVVVGRRMVEAPVSGEENNSEAVYMVSLSKDYKPEDLTEYIKLAPQAFKAYEGRYMARATQVEVLEGSFDYLNFSMSRWPSAEKAKEFWYSPQYTEAKKKREGLGDFTAFIVSELPQKNKR